MDYVWKIVAMKTPWLPALYQAFKKEQYQCPEERLTLRGKNNYNYFNSLVRDYSPHLEETKVLKKLKALIRYSFDDYEDGEMIKRGLLRTPELTDFKQTLFSL